MAPDVINCVTVDPVGHRALAAYRLANGHCPAPHGSVPATVAKALMAVSSRLLVGIKGTINLAGTLRSRTPAA